jgi:hypothetical protein
MDEPYARPSRAEIAARVHAELAAGQQDQEAEVAPPVARCPTAVGHRVACGARIGLVHAD